MAVRGFKTWCESIAIEIRRKLHLKAVAPLLSEQLAEHLGVMLLTPKDIPGLSTETIKTLLGQEKNSWSALTVSSSTTDLVIYNSAHSIGRQSNDIMHELAHILLGHDPGRVMIFADGQALRTYNAEQEEEATLLGGYLLLPRQALVHIRKSNWDEQTVCNLYRVTPTLLNYRLNVSGVNLQFRRARSFTSVVSHK